MKKIIQFGENVEGYHIPVLNEREIRAAAGIYFILLFLSLVLIGTSDHFLMAKYFLTLFLTDFIIRVFINPGYAPSLIIGRWIVKNQVPEYVGAPQKKFAWKIGLFLSAGIFIHLVIFNAYSIITGLLCLSCLIFLFFESAFGICLGCKIYNGIKKDKAQHCPGEVCTKADRHEIQKTSTVHLLIVLGLVGFVMLVAIFFNDNFSQQPVELLSNH